MAASDPSRLIRRVALIAGQPRLWEDDGNTAIADLHATARILDWAHASATSANPVHLGLDPRGVGLILRGLYRARGASPSAAVEARLDRAGARQIDVPLLPGDEIRFGGREEELLGLLDRSPTRHEAIWLEPSEAARWRAWLSDGLIETAELGGELKGIAPFRHRHGFTLFAPLGAEIVTAKGDRCDTSGGPCFWSWRIAPLDESEADVAAPLLALWSDWPASRRWAPPAERRDKERVARCWSDEEAAGFLEETLRRKVLSAFDATAQACGLRPAALDFEGVHYRPPLFYVVEPVQRPKRPEELLSRTEGSLHRLARMCLDVDDIFAHQVAWSVLQGDFVALRREKVSVERGYFSSWHLLMPTDVKGVGEEEVERDLACIAEALTTADFLLAHRAHRLLERYHDLAGPQDLWRHLLNEMDPVIADAIDLLPTLRKGQRRQMLGEIRELSIPLRQLVTLSETVGKQLHDLQPEFENLVRSAEERVTEQLDVSTLPDVQPLHQAFRQSYAFRRLDQQLGAQRDRASVLAASTDRISSALGAFLDDENQRVSEQLDRITRRIGPVLAILSFLLALPQFLEFTIITKDDQERFLHWVDHQFGVTLVTDSIEVIEQVFISGLAVTALLIIILAIFWALFQSALMDRPPAVSSALFYFWNAVDVARRRTRAATMSGVRQQRALDDLDTTASEYLAQIAAEVERLDRTRRRRDDLDGGEGLPFDLLVPLPPSVGRRRVRRWWRERRDRRRRVADWLARTRLARYRAHFWARQPDLLEFPLPRTWCLLRFKAERLVGEAGMPPERWDASLAGAGFTPGDAGLLNQWLTTPERLDEIAALSPSDFAARLKRRHVTVIAAQRTPALWNGSLKGDPVAPAAPGAPVDVAGEPVDAAAGLAVAELD